MPTKKKPTLVEGFVDAASTHALIIPADADAPVREVAAATFASVKAALSDVFLAPVRAVPEFAGTVVLVDEDAAMMGVPRAPLNVRASMLAGQTLYGDAAWCSKRVLAK